MEKKRKKLMTNFIAGLCTFVILVAMWGCKTRTVYIDRDVIKHDTTLVYNTRVDSLRLVDSVVIKAVSDTVVIEKYKFRDRWRCMYDSIYIERTDTFKIVEKQIISKEPSKMDNFLHVSGIIWWVFFAVFILGYCVKKFVF